MYQGRLHHGPMGALRRQHHVAAHLLVCALVSALVGAVQGVVAECASPPCKVSSRPTTTCSCQNVTRSCPRRLSRAATRPLCFRRRKTCECVWRSACAADGRLSCRVLFDRVCINNEEAAEPHGMKFSPFYEDGIYKCSCCGAELYSSSTKYDHYNGEEEEWPAFWSPLARTVGEHSLSVIYHPDGSGGGELVCSKCG